MTHAEWFVLLLIITAFGYWIITIFGGFKSFLTLIVVIISLCLAPFLVIPKIAWQIAGEWAEWFHGEMKK